MRMNTSDESLALAAAGGDADAFSALIERHYDAVFRLAFRLTGAQTEAEDLTQDVCAVLPAKLLSFRGTSKFTTWLWRVVVNAAHDQRRRAATRAKYAQGWGAWETNRRAADADTAQGVEWLSEAMRALPEELRDTLALVLDDMSHAEAGEVLGISGGTVSWRISEAKKQLRVIRAREEDA